MAEALAETARPNVAAIIADGNLAVIATGNHKGLKYKLYTPLSWIALSLFTA